MPVQKAAQRIPQRIALVPVLLALPIQQLLARTCAHAGGNPAQIGSERRVARRSPDGHRDPVLQHCSS